MERHFPDATVFPPQELIAAMTNDPKDRHVMAAAVMAGASVIVTDNLKDFRPSATEPYGIDVQSTDEFLSTQFGLSPETFMAIAAHIVETYRNPPYTHATLLERLQKTVPIFAGCLAEHD